MINTVTIFQLTFWTNFDHFVMLTAGLGKFKVKLLGGPGPLQ